MEYGHECPEVYGDPAILMPYIYSPHCEVKHDFLAIMRKKAIFALQNEDKTHRRRMDYQTLIQQYYPQDDSLRRLLLLHSQQVANRCLNICDRHPELHLDRAFLDEAAMLHDIGIR